MRAVEVFVLVTLVLALATLLVFGSRYIVPGHDIRDIGEFYLYTMYNPGKQYYTVFSPQAVSAILWDYRGLDTLFETAVFYLAIIASLALGRGLYLEEHGSRRGIGLSVIVKSVTRITSPMIISVGASIALHGHLTPGGGFQAGSTIAVVPMLLIVIFSVFFVLDLGVRVNKAIVLNAVGLTGILLTSMILYIIGFFIGQYAYVFQNIAKPGSQLSMPIRVGDVLTSGTLWFFNLFEMFAVASGFMMILIVLVLMKAER